MFASSKNAMSCASPWMSPSMIMLDRHIMSLTKVSTFSSTGIFLMSFST